MYSNHITEGNQSIFLLRIKKKAEDSGQKNRNVELELRTPKPPTLLPTPAVAPSQPVADLIVENAHNPNKSEEIVKQPAKVSNNKNNKNNKQKKKRK